MGVRDVLVQGDVSKEDDVVAMVEAAADGLEGLDIHVNNAGIQISRLSSELSSADFDKVIAVNLRGSFLCAREAIKRFLVGEAALKLHDRAREAGASHPRTVGQAPDGPNRIVT
jgi:NAD(P)-dependent dehydrogenase (short-subunit alcohol dehydrogenase family)